MRTFEAYYKTSKQEPSVGMKPLSERDENQSAELLEKCSLAVGRNEATL